MFFFLNLTVTQVPLCEHMAEQQFTGRALVPGSW